MKPVSPLYTVLGAFERTTLIKKFLKEKNAFYYLATKEVEPQCMKRFADNILKEIGDTTISNAKLLVLLKSLCIFRMISGNPR